MPFCNLPGVTTCRFAPKEYLMRRDEPMPYVYYLRKGEVKREVLTPYGSELINTIKVEGQITGSIVGLMQIYSRNFNGTSSDDFIAITECVCCRVPVDVCKQYLGEHPELLAEALTMSIALFDEMEAFMTHRRDLHAPQLVSEFLLTHYVQSPIGPLLPKKFSNVEIAKYLSMHSVTVSRIMSVWRREAVLERIDEGWLLLDLDALRAYLNGERTMKYD